MKRLLDILIITIIGFLARDTVAATVEYLTLKPMSQSVQVSVKTFTGRTWEVPLIAWGGDIATILADMEGYFREEGLEVTLFREDNFAKQVEKCLSGETPFLRGTMGMINAATDACRSHNVDLVVVYQMTWSVGGDAMVVRPGKSLKNISTVALQLYGPHMDYVSNVFKTAGRLDRVKFKWLQDLNLPAQDTGRITDPVSAFQADSTLDAVMCIIPDALMLTSGGKQGTGADESVKGAAISLTTKTASRIIADVYAVRKDYFDTHQAEIQKFVRVLMRGEEALRDLVKNKGSQQARYRQLMAKSAELLMGASQATSDAEALLGDCEYVGHGGNIAFFTGRGTTRTFSNLNSEIQGAFLQMGILTAKASISQANWNFAALGAGLKYAVSVSPTATQAPPVVTAKKFDTQKVKAKVEQDISKIEPSVWEEEGTLFVVEIYFEPNQSDFLISQYADDFEKALQIAQTYFGSLIIVEGHSDPLGILKAQQKGETQVILEQMKQNAKNLSLQRSNAVRESFLAFCRERAIGVDESQFISVGLGITIPKFNPPRTQQEWAANRRVVFRIKQVEAELEEFSPL